MRKAAIFLLVLGIIVWGSILFTGVAFADQPTQLPAATDTVNPGNACFTPAFVHTTGFSNPPGVTTGVKGSANASPGGTPPTCSGVHTV